MTKAPTKLVMACFLVAAVRLGAACPGLAVEPAAADSEATLKAAFLLNFARYTEWPAASFERDDSPIDVCVLGDESVAKALEALAQRAAPIGGRELAVRFVAPERAEALGRRHLADELRDTEVLYIGEELSDNLLPRLLEDLANTHLLTVGDLDGFAVAGGMLGLVRENQRIAFDANPAAIRASGLSVSARVLKLARELAGTTP